VTGDCYVVRHAHRDTSDRSRDNGLSKKGRAQAARLAARFGALEGPAPRVVRSSPKRRCLETAAPLARLWGVAVVADDALDERGEAESRRAFRVRIAAVLRRAALEAAAGRPAVLVTHGDVAAEAPAVALGARSRAAEPFPCAKGAFHHLRRDGRDWVVAAANDRAHLPRARRVP
jgi:broad specificity phosphatase PhoE